MSISTDTDGDRYQDLDQENIHASIAQQRDNQLIPRNVKETFACHDCDKWKEAVDKELSSHAQNGNGEVVPRSDKAR
jgi:hypothetical protein